MARSTRGDGFSVKSQNTSTLDLFDNLMAENTEAPAPVKEKESSPKEAPVKENTKLTKDTPKTPEKKPEAAKKVQSLRIEENTKVESSYNMSRKSVTISVLEDEDMFLRFHSAKKGISRQDLLEEIFSNEIKNVKSGNIPEFDEIKPYMKQLKEPTRFTAMMKEDLIDDIKKTASMIGLRPTAFMAYSIHKYQLTSN